MTKFLILNMFVYVFNVRVHKNVYQNQKNNTLKTYTHFYVSIVRSGSEDQLLCNILKLLFMDVRIPRDLMKQSPSYCVLAVSIWAGPLLTDMG